MSEEKDTVTTKALYSLWKTLIGDMEDLSEYDDECITIKPPLVTGDIGDMPGPNLTKIVDISGIVSPEYVKASDENRSALDELATQRAVPRIWGHLCPKCGGIGEQRPLFNSFYIHCDECDK